MAEHDVATSALVSLKNAAVDVERLSRTIGKLRAAIEESITDLDADHYEHPDDDRLCAICHGGWPCTARLIADDLRRALEEDR